MPRVKTPPPIVAKEKEPVILAELSPLQLKAGLANWQHHLMYSPHIIDDSKRQLMVDLEAELYSREISILTDTVQVEKVK